MLAWQIALGDLKRFTRDRGALATSFLLPVALLALMLGAFRGDGGFRGTATFVDLDQSPESHALIARVEATEGIDIELLTEEKAMRLLEGSTRVHVTVVRAGFGEALRSGSATPEIEFRKRSYGGEMGQIVAAVVRSEAEALAGQAAVRRLVAAQFASEGRPVEGLTLDRAVTAALAAEQAQPSVSTYARSYDEEETDFFKVFFPGILTMITFMAVGFAAQGIVEEREAGTLERMMSTRATPGVLFAGKFLSGFIRGYLQAAILLTLGWAAFRSFGPLQYGEFLAFTLLLAGAASAVAVFVAAIARTRDQATWLAVIITITMAVIGGSFFDLELNGVLDVLSRLSLNYYGNTGLRGILSGDLTLLETWPHMLVLGGAAVVLVGISRPLFSGLQGGRR